MTSNQFSDITVTGRFFGKFKEISQEREIEFRLKIGSSISNFLNNLIREFPSMKELIYNEKDELHSWISILRNGRNIKALDGINTLLSDGDVLAVFPPVAGG